MEVKQLKQLVFMKINERKLNIMKFGAIFNFNFIILFGLVSANFFIWSSIRLYSYCYLMFLIYLFLSIIAAFYSFACYIGWKDCCKFNKENKN
jgi:hypothetical protein